MSEEIQVYHVYDPIAKKWYASDGWWTDQLEMAWKFKTWHDANAVLQKEKCYGLYITSRPIRKTV